MRKMQKCTINASGALSAEFSPLTLFRNSVLTFVLIIRKDGFLSHLQTLVFVLEGLYYHLSLI